MSKQSDKLKTCAAPCRTFGDPSDYLLLSKIGGMKRHPDLIRCAPNAPIPPGWERVERLHGQPVCQDNGRLQPKFMALRRYPQDFQNQGAS